MSIHVLSRPLAWPWQGVLAALSVPFLTSPCCAGAEELRLDREITAVAWTSDGSLLGVGTEDGKVRLVDPVKMRSVEEIQSGDSAVRQLAFDAAGRTFAVATKRRLIAWEKKSDAWQQSATYQIPEHWQVALVWFAKDLREVYFHIQVNYHGHPCTWNLTTGKVEAAYIPWKERSIEVTGGPVISTDGRSAWIPVIRDGLAKGESVRVDLATRKVVDRIEQISMGGLLGNKDQTLVLAMPGMLIGGSNSNCTLTFWDVAKKEKIDELIGGYGLKAFSPEDNLAILTHHALGNRLLFYHVGHRGDKWPDQPELRADIALFSPCGNYLATANGKTFRCERTPHLSPMAPPFEPTPPKPGPASLAPNP
ncbi:MAG: hypothetical protein HQ567_31870 [Candidatus Nealsonbacteria bacterium]|nr:hypothetical protein [Candidatus Nealsonbacteria bacterium]